MCVYFGQSQMTICGRDSSFYIICWKSQPFSETKHFILQVIVAAPEHLLADIPI